MIRVLIAGEGANEIGRWAGRNGTDAERTSGAGVIEVLLEKVRRGGWEILHALKWKDVRKLRANAPGEGDARTVKALALLATEKGCHSLVFLRDRDGHQSRERVIVAALRGIE